MELLMRDTRALRDERRIDREMARKFWCATALTQRLFPHVSELQVRVDGVGATPRHCSAVDVAVRESMCLVSERRQFRDGVPATQVYSAAPSSRRSPSSTRRTSLEKSGRRP